MMERGRYNVGNSQMGKGCITYGASKKRSLPWRDRERERREGGRGKMACLCPFHTLLKGTRSFYPSLSVILKYVKATMIRPSPLPFLPFLASSSLYRSQKCQLRSLFASWDLSPRDFLIFLSKWRSRGEGNSRRSSMVTMAYRTKGGGESFSFLRGYR